MLIADCARSVTMNDTNDKVPSNEEVIEELTKDLENSCINVNENSTTDNPDATSRDVADDSLLTECEKEVCLYVICVLFFMCTCVASIIYCNIYLIYFIFRKGRAKLRP